MNNRSLLLASLVGGVVMSLLVTIPIVNFINCLACAGVWLSGALAVWFYRRREPFAKVSAAQGAAIGALSGVFGALIGAALGALFGGAAMAALVAADPSGSLEDALGGAVGAGVSSLIWLVVSIFLYPIFGAIGGAGFAALREDRKAT